MKILFTRFPLESSYGGAEVQTLSLMKGLGKSGHAVAFAGSCPTLLKLCKQEGIPSVTLEIGAPPVTPWKAISFAGRRGSMRAKLKKMLEGFHDLDAICMLSLSEKLLLTPLALNRGIKVIWIEHDRVGRWLNKNPWLPELRKLSHKVTTITVSDLSRELYLKLGWAPEKVISIPNGIDLSQFQRSWGLARPEPVEGRAPAAGDFDSLRVGSVSRLSTDKGIDVLIQAVSDMPNVQLTIVGKGKEEGFLRTLIREIEERTHLQQITIERFVEDLPSFYQSLDVFVLPSREHDPFGLVAAEAMAAGVATVVTDACGIASHIKEGEALVVRADDPLALRKGLEDLQNADRRARVALAGKEAVWKRFGSDEMIERYLQLLA